MSTITPTRTASPRPTPPRPSRPRPSKLASNVDPIKVLRRHMLGIIIAAIFGAVFGYGANVLLAKYSPLYTGSVRFEIRNGIEKSTEIVGTDELSGETIARIAETESLLITSHSLLLDSLENNPEIRDTKWHEKFVDEDGIFLINEAADELVEDVTAGLIRGTQVFQVSWSASNKNDVPIVLNGIRRAYMAAREDIDEATYNENLGLFNSELTATQRRIEDLSIQIASFIREKGITSLDDPRYSQTAETLKNLSLQRNKAETNLSFTQSLKSQVAAKLSGTIEPTEEDFREAEKSMNVQAQKRELTQIAQRLSVLRERFVDPEHPSIREMEQQQRAAERELERYIDEEIRQNLNATLREASAQEESLKRTIEQLVTQAELEQERMSQLAADQAEYEALDTERDKLLEQRESDVSLIREVRLMKARQDASRIRVSQTAQTPRELAFPKLYMMVPLGVVLMVGLLLGIVFLREFTDQRVKTASDLEVLPRCEVVGVIPELAEDPTRRKSKSTDLIVDHHPNSVLAESYRQTAAPILRSMDTAGHQTLLLVGGLPGSGTTTVVTNLAATLAASGRRVACVDANFRRPRLAQAMGIETPGVGLGDYLAGQSQASDIITETHDVAVIPAGTPGNRVFERLNLSKFDSLMAELRDQYDIVLVDAPPAVVAGDAMVLANKLDAIALVVRANQEQRGLVARLINQFTDARSALIGVVLNRPRGTAGGYFKKNFAAMAQYAADEKKG